IEVLDQDTVKLRAYCVVGSPMYGPYPFANAKRTDFEEDNHAKPLDLGGDRTMRYTGKGWGPRGAVTLGHIDLVAWPRGGRVGEQSVRFNLAASAMPHA